MKNFIIPDTLRIGEYYSNDQIKYALEVANLRGSLGFNSFGVIISTSHFTSSAINEAGSLSKSPINLVGMKELYAIIKETSFVV
ncbi:MAG: hypothetical protein V1655_01200 [bacterium]